MILIIIAFIYNAYNIYSIFALIKKIKNSNKKLNHVINMYNRLVEETAKFPIDENFKRQLYADTIILQSME